MNLRLSLTVSQRQVSQDDSDGGGKYSQVWFFIDSKKPQRNKLMSPLRKSFTGCQLSLYSFTHKKVSMMTNASTYVSNFIIILAFLMQMVSR